LELKGLEKIELSSFSKHVRSIISSIDKVLSRREEIRDTLIKNGRDIIRLSGWAINAIHRGLLEDAKKHIDQMDKIVKEFISLASTDAFLRESGFVYNVLSEYVEAKVFYSLLVEGYLPGPEELGVSEVPYLQGLGDTLGELRRLALDLMRLGRLGMAERILDIMETMYYELRALEYPDALMPGVRHKVDVARRLIDDTKSLLLAVRARMGGSTP
jgi:translin